MHLACERTSVRPFFGRVESLRGLGAMAVAGYHFGGIALHGQPLLPDSRWPEADWVQNSLRHVGSVVFAAHAFLMAFFVISGFVLRVSLEYGPAHPVTGGARFFLGRIFRLYPIVFFAVAVMVLSSARDISTGEILGNALLINVSLNGSWWALQVEMLMVPIILALFLLERKFGPRLLVVVAIATTLLVYVPRWTGWPPLSASMFAFVLGMMVPTLGRRFAQGLSPRRATWLLIFVALAFFLPNPLFGRYSKFSTLVEGYAAYILICLIAYRHDLFALKWLDARPIRMVGTASGSYYVLHMATVPIAIALATAVVPASWSTSFPALVGMLVIGCWLLAFAPLTIATYHLIEATGIKLGRHAVRFLRIDGQPRTQPIPSAIPEALIRKAA